MFMEELLSKKHKTSSSSSSSTTNKDNVKGKGNVTILLETKEEEEEEEETIKKENGDLYEDAYFDAFNEIKELKNTIIPECLYLIYSYLYINDKWSNLVEGELIDCMDDNNHWYLGRIINVETLITKEEEEEQRNHGKKKKKTNKLKIGFVTVDFVRWETKWSVRIPRKEFSWRITWPHTHLNTRPYLSKNDLISWQTTNSAVHRSKVLEVTQQKMSWSIDLQSNAIFSTSSSSSPSLSSCMHHLYMDFAYLQPVEHRQRDPQEKANCACAECVFSFLDENEEHTKQKQKLIKQKNWQTFLQSFDPCPSSSCKLRFAQENNNGDNSKSEPPNKETKKTKHGGRYYDLFNFRQLRRCKCPLKVSMEACFCVCEIEPHNNEEPRQPLGIVAYFPYLPIESF